MKKIFACLVLVLSLSNLFAQRLTNAEKKAFRASEDTLKQFCSGIVNEREASGRFHKDSLFITSLVRTLKQKNSFYYPFDSLQNISRLYSPDSGFRIFTWQVMKDDAVFRRKGAIQMRTPDGSLKLFPLLDATHIINNPDTITDNTRWFGAIYYTIVLKKVEGKNVYTLFGYDENSIRSTKKRLEILRFTTDGRPVFGGPFFSFDQDTVPKPTRYRFAIEYKKEGRARIQYDEEQKMIIYDHLISESEEPGKKYTYIPDGDYEGFKWENNRWTHIEKVYTFKLNDGEFPVANPIYDNKKVDPTEKPTEKPKKPQKKG